MPRIKRIVPTGYTTVNNDFLRDTTLSLSARGLLITMLSLPDGWNMSGKGLASILPDGRDKVYSTLNKLEEKGYLHRERIRENGCFVDVEYQFCDTPIFLEKNKASKKKKKKPSPPPSSSKKEKEEKKKIDFSLISPREESMEEMKEKMNSLVGGEREDYIALKILEKEKCLTQLNVPESYFNYVAEIFSNLLDANDEARDKLIEFSALDVAALYESKKKKSKAAVEKFFLNEDPIFAK